MRPITRGGRLFAALALAALASVCGVSRCEGEDVLFSDDFKTADPAWGFDAPIKDGKLTVEPPLKISRSFLNEANVFDDMTCSIKVHIVSDDDAGCPGGGLIFWAKDDSNFYELVVTPSGKVAVWRLVNNRWITPVSLRDCPDVKKGKDAWNLLKVVIRGNQATVSINGKDVATFKGQPPDGGGMIGVCGECGEKKSVYEFSDPTVTK